MKEKEFHVLAWDVRKLGRLLVKKAKNPNPMHIRSIAMKKSVQQIRRTLLVVIMAGMGGAGFATTASAVGVGVGVGVNAQAGATAGTQMSTSGSTNSNAQWQEGANKGAERAGERMSEKGAENKPAAGTEPEATTTTKGKRTDKR
jgi:hypothetical protein